LPIEKGNKIVVLWHLTLLLEW